LFTFQDFNTLIQSALRSEVVDTKLISEDVSEMLLPDSEILSFTKSSYNAWLKNKLAYFYETQVSTHKTYYMHIYSLPISFV